MNTEAIFNAIRTRFNALVGQPEKIAVQYDNAPFIKPDDKVWARLTILPSESIQVSVGSSKRFRTPGVFIVQIFVPTGRGDQPGVALADKIVTAFRSVSASGISYQTPSSQPIGTTDGYWQINVTCPFYADDIEA